jgi:hypothetical protein
MNAKQNPITVPVFALVKQTSLSVFPCHSGFCQNHRPKQICVVSKKKSEIRVKVFITASVINKYNILFISVSASGEKVRSQ